MALRRCIAGAALAGFLLGAASADARAEALEQVLSSVVSVLPQMPPSTRRLEEPEGSGVAMLDGRTVATALHVVATALSVQVRTADGRILKANVAASDPATDVAILSIEEALPPIPLAPDDPQLGARVCAIGNAFGLGLTVTCGVVSGVHRAGVGFNAIEDFVQTDAAVNPGASGGALVTADGRLVGLLSAIFTKQSDANIGINFAVSTDLVEHVVRGLKENGRVERPQSGLRLESVPEHGETGRLAARVTTVIQGSPADQAGIRTGDLLVRAGGRRVRAPADFVSVMGLATAGQELDVLLVRDGEERSVTLKF